MSAMERIELVSAIYEAGFDELCRFTVNSVHLFTDEDIDARGSWQVILTPLSTRIYFLGLIMGLVNTLDLNVAAYVDVDRPGCIIFE